MNLFKAISRVFSVCLVLGSLSPGLSFAQGGPPPPPPPPPPTYLPGYGLHIGSGAYLSGGIKKDISVTVVVIRITFNRSGQPPLHFDSLDTASRDPRLSDQQREKIKQLLPGVHQLQSELSRIQEEFRVQGQKQKSVSLRADFAKQEQKLKEIIQRYTSSVPGFEIDLLP